MLALYYLFIKIICLNVFQKQKKSSWVQWPGLIFNRKASVIFLFSSKKASYIETFRSVNLCGLRNNIYWCISDTSSRWGLIQTLHCVRYRITQPANKFHDIRDGTAIICKSENYKYSFVRQMPLQSSLNRNSSSGTTCLCFSVAPQRHTETVNWTSQIKYVSWARSDHKYALSTHIYSVADVRPCIYL